MTPRPIRGAALVAAMLVAALAAAVVATLASSQSLWQRDVALRRDQVQAQALVLAGLSWARSAIALDAAGAPIDHPGEPWALPLPPTPVENGFIEGHIVDAQSRLNLNNVADDGATGRAGRARLTRLFARAGIAGEAVLALADFVDADDTTRESGAEAAAYAASGRAVPNARLHRAAEATLVRGVDERRYAAIAALVTALPAATPVNVNTASPDVLATLLDGASPDAVAAIVADRSRKPYASVAEFRSRLPRDVTIDEESAIAVKSDHFLVTVRARQGETVAQGRSLLARRSGEPLPRVVWQTIE